MTIHSNEELGELLVHVAAASDADVIMCATAEGALLEQLRTRADGIPVLAATTSQETFDRLRRTEVDALRLPLRTADKYRQVDHMLSMALREEKIAPGSLVLCATGCNFYEDASPVVLLTDVDPEKQHLRLSDLLKLTDGVQARVLESAIGVACQIGRSARRGKRIGTIIVLGDSSAVLEGSRQLVPNPFEGHQRESREITNAATHDAILELAKLDGAFVARGDGFIRSAGVFLASAVTEEDGITMPSGLGARHVAAAAVTARTAATSVVVSATDGNVRVFSGGEMVMQVDPEAVQQVQLE